MAENYGVGPFDGGNPTGTQKDRIAFAQAMDAPAAVAVPVSNGTTLAGIAKGFQSLYRRGKTSRIPRLIAGSSYRKDPTK